jgi:hypothetical protein
MSRPSPHRTPVGRFADRLLARDLPLLVAPRRDDTVRFIQERVDDMPSFTRFGVLVISHLVDVTGRLIGENRTMELIIGLPLPLLSEYPRLVRSLGFTFIWETWPDTAVDGAAA